MAYLLASNIVLGICFIVYVIKSTKEREHLCDLLSAKDYADYKNFEDKPKTDRKKSNMFIAREQRIKEVEE